MNIGIESDLPPRGSADAIANDVEDAGLQASHASPQWASDRAPLWSLVVLPDIQTVFNVHEPGERFRVFAIMIIDRIEPAPEQHLFMMDTVKTGLIASPRDHDWAFLWDAHGSPLVTISAPRAHSCQVET